MYAKVIAAYPAHSADECAAFQLQEDFLPFERCYPSGAPADPPRRKIANVDHLLGKALAPH